MAALKSMQQIEFLGFTGVSSQRVGHSMTKQYREIIEDVPVAGGGLLRAVRMAIVEFTCLGERKLDVSGYPYPSAADALAADWEALGRDFKAAEAKIIKEADGVSDANRKPSESAVGLDTAA